MISQALLAETRRWQRSALLIVPVLGLVMATIQGLVTLGTGQATTWSQVQAGNVLWATSLAQPTAAVLLGLVHRRERLARAGGTWWRPVTSLQTGLARLLVTVGVVLIMNLLVVLPTLLTGLLVVGAAPPLGRVTALAVLLTLGCVAMLPLYDLLAGRWGLAVVAPVVIGWSMIGVLTAESPLWWAIAPAWPIRTVLPILHTHANGVGLEPGAALAEESPLPAAALVVGWVVLGLIIFSLVRHRADHRGGASSTGTRRRPGTRRTEPGEPADPAALLTPPRRVRPRPIVAQFTVLRRTVIGPLIIAALSAQLFILLIWHRPGYSAGFFELLVLPAGASLLSVLGWHAGSAGWRALAVRGIPVGRLIRSQLIAYSMIITGVALLSTGLILITGEDPSRAVRGLLLAITVGWMLMLLAWWLTVAVGAGLAYAVLGLGIVTGLVLGAGELAGRLWPFGAWGWAHSGTTSWSRTLIIMIITLVVGAALIPAVTTAARRRAALN